MSESGDVKRALAEAATVADLHAVARLIWGAGNESGPAVRLGLMVLVSLETRDALLEVTRAVLVGPPGAEFPETSDYLRARCAWDDRFVEWAEVEVRAERLGEHDAPIGDEERERLQRLFELATPHAADIPLQEILYP